MTEASPFRDNGPFHSAEQARQQFQATSSGIPGGTDFTHSLCLGEAILGTRITVSPYEDEIRRTLGMVLPTEAIQVIAGWIIRAFLAGIDIGEVQTATTADEQ